MPSESSSVDSLSAALRSLQLRHRQQLTDLLDYHQREVQALLPSPSAASSATSSPPVSPSLTPSPSVHPTPPLSSARSRFGSPLVLGSPVRVLSSAKSGRIGDTAVVTKPPSAHPNAFVTIRLDSTGTTTTRKPNNLELLS